MADNLFDRLARQPAAKNDTPEPEQLPITIPRGPLLQPIVPPANHNSPPIEKCLDWLVNRWPKPSVRIRDFLQFGPPAARNRKSATALAESLAAAGWLAPLKTRQHNMKLWRIVRGPHEPPSEDHFPKTSGHRV
jgi:hypothetical protein